VSGRPSDWYPVEMWEDPTPGDADATVDAGRHYRDVADAIETAARRLREIASAPDMESEAVEAFVGKAEEVANNIDRAHERYRGVGDALYTYGFQLGRAQDDADDALRRAIAAREDAGAARARLDTARQNLQQAQDDDAAAPPEAPPADLSGHQSAVSRAEGDVADAEMAWQRAISDAQQAKEDAESAARAAREAIEDVKDSGDLNDSTWDNVAGALKKLADFAGMVAAVCGILALAVGWIPVIGQALAAVLGTIALVAGLVSLLCNVALLIGGKGSLKSVILDLVGVLSFGIGRAVVAGARGAYRGAQGLARMNAGRLAATSPASRLAAGLPGGSSASAIRGMLGGNNAISNLTRVQARSMLQAGRSAPVFSASAPFTSAWDDVTSIGSNLSTVSNRSNLSAALSQSRGSWNAITDGSSSMAERLARFTGNSDALAHIDFTHSIDAAVRQGDMFTRATALTGVQFGTTGLSFGLDTYQFVTSDLWADTFNSPADQMNLPGDGVLAR
jgi:hypothetical protein